MKKILFMVLFGLTFTLTSCGQKSPEKKVQADKAKTDSITTQRGLVQISSEKQFDDLIKREGLTLVDFYATWCGPCKMMHPVLEQLSKLCAGKVMVLKVDVDQNEALAARYNIQMIPTLLLFKKGEKVWNTTGVIGLEPLQNIINQNK